VINKFTSTFYGRVAILISVAVCVLLIKIILDRVIPFVLLQDVKSGKVTAAADGSVMLPWYMQFESASGCAYVTHHDNEIFILFPQEAYGESRFSGEVATNVPIKIGTDTPCQDKNTSCVTIFAPQVASSPKGGAKGTIVLTGKITDGLYAAECTDE
jgi:hypothetical protein